MDFVGIESFIKLYEYKNYTKAAEHLGISRSSLSKRISALENELGTELINRNQKNFKLTPAGSVLLEKCYEMISLRNETFSSIIDTISNRTLELRIGYNPNDAPLLLLYYLIYEYSAVSPRSKISLVPYELSDNRSEMLKYGKVDALICPKSDFAYINDIKYRTLVKIKNYGVMVSAKHPLADRKSLNIEELSPYPLVYIDREGLREGHPLMRALGRYGLDQKPVILTHDRLETVAWLMSGNGVGLCNMEYSFYFEDIIGENYLRKIPLRGSDLKSWDLVIAYDSTSEAITSFVDFCVSHVAGFSLESMSRLSE